jgi:sigma-B regulation protein RsbU (phosphoserine phosphatase)
VTTPIDPLLARQLRRLSLSSELEQSPAWEKFVAQINEHYVHMADDRALLSRSIELSTQEIEDLRRRFDSQRNSLLAVINGISESLGSFVEDLQDEVQAKIALAGRLQAILDDTRAADRGVEVSGIRDNVLRIADQLISLLAKASTHATVRKELEVARAVQQLLIPAQATIEMQQMRFAGHFDPAEECGGDWWTVAPLPGDRALVVVGDVTGHGIASAIITGAAKATCELALQLTSDTLTPSRLLAMMNQTLYRMARRKIMMTSVAAVLDPGKRTLTVANAGHPFPILVRNSITHPIMAEGPQLGDSPRASYEDSTVELHSGDVMVCFTDGVTELENERGERFTERRLRTVVQRSATQGASSVCAALVEALGQFRGTRPAGDDLTLVVTSVA